MYNILGQVGEVEISQYLTSQNVVYGVFLAGAIAGVSWLLPRIKRGREEALRRENEERQRQEALDEFLDPGEPRKV